MFPAKTATGAEAKTLAPVRILAQGAAVDLKYVAVIEDDRLGAAGGDVGRIPVPDRQSRAPPARR